MIFVTKEKVSFSWELIFLTHFKKDIQKHSFLK